MKLKSAHFLTLFIFLFIFTANISLEARHHHRRTTTYITNTYVAPAPQPVYVVQEYRQPAVYAPVQTVVYQQPIYQERAVIRERQSPASFFTSFALGLGFGLLAH